MVVPSQKLSGSQLTSAVPKAWPGTSLPASAFCAIISKNRPARAEFTHLQPTEDDLRPYRPGK
jgi:hypothetical protein